MSSLRWQIHNLKIEVTWLFFEKNTSSDTSFKGSFFQGIHWSSRILSIRKTDRVIRVFRWTKKKKQKIPQTDLICYSMTALVTPCMAAICLLVFSFLLLLYGQYSNMHEYHLTLPQVRRRWRSMDENCTYFLPHLGHTCLPKILRLEHLFFLRFWGGFKKN